MGQLRADVDAVRRVDGVEVLAEGFPSPPDALVERSARDVLDALHHLDELVFSAGVHRREPHPAVAHHHGRDAMPTGRRHLLVPADLTVEMGVDVDEARSEQLSLGVDRAGGAALDPTDLGDPPVLDRDITPECRSAGSVHDSGVGHDEIIHSIP